VKIKFAACNRIVSAAAALAWCLSLLLSANDVRASVSPPFAITHFSMQTVAATREIPVGPGHVDFVNEPYSFTQAGGHPWGLTTTIEFASEEIPTKTGERTILVPTRDPKDIVVALPPGLLGDPVATPRCSLATIHEGHRCPSSTQVGVYRIRWQGGKEEMAPIINVVPEAGQSAEFALENEIKITPVLTAHLVRTEDGSLGFAVVSNEIPEVEVSRVETTFWGVPADPSHDALRGRVCNSVILGQALSCQRVSDPSASVPAVPFLTMPTGCTSGPETATVRADSWQEPGRVLENQHFIGYAKAESVLPGATGCDLLSFRPTIELQPDTQLADEPVGISVNLNVPQNEEPQNLATPQLRNSVVTLPEGMSVNPGVVDGVKACNATGPEGINFSGSESEEVGPNDELRLAPGHCPDASIVGTAEAITPLLSVPVKGHIYLARPDCGGPGEDPCTEQDALNGRLYKLYLELGGTGEFAATGIQIKVAGKVEANPATGQLTTVFENNPQAPFSELKIHLNGGPRAPLASPATCGSAVTTTDFTPWSAPGWTPLPERIFVAGTPDATPSSFFTVVGCSQPVAFNPRFLAGTVTPRAARFSSFVVNLFRQDRDQYIKGVRLHTPPGLLGMLSSVPLCGEPQAQSGQCPAASRIGTTMVASGAGSHPFEIRGDVFLTGPYDGAPFGLSVVTDAVAGPFNLGVVVVRARIEVNRADSSLTVTTDETGAHAIPQIIFGVPLRLQRITVNIDRPNFMFNPTNCSALSIGATLVGAQNALASVSSPFAVGGCKGLAFKPQFKVSTSGRTSRSKGASLDAKLSYPSGALGNDANIARVKVSLPKQLPSRLTTLQKACLSWIFEANPAACPKESIVGIARASTPLLPVGLIGPVYFVSHGGEAFPSLIVVLQGDNVRVDLTGTTFISKKGITSSTFKTVPDVPVNSFELYLPQGRFSALAANGSLCKTVKKLIMPTEFVAQNGSVIRRATKIKVTDCPAAKKTSAPRRNARARRAAVAIYRYMGLAVNGDRRAGR
jgi:hypothetical protein